MKLNSVKALEKSLMALSSASTHQLGRSPRFRQRPMGRDVACKVSLWWAAFLPLLGSLSYFFAPAFERLPDKRHELIGNGAVNYAVVVSKGQMDQRSHGDGIISLFIRDNDRRFGDSADAHDCGIRLINNWQTKHRAKLSWIRDGEGGAFDIFRSKFLR